MQKRKFEPEETICLDDDEDEPAVSNSMTPMLSPRAYAAPAFQWSNPSGPKRMAPSTVTSAKPDKPAVIDLTLSDSESEDDPMPVPIRPIKIRKNRIIQDDTSSSSGSGSKSSKASSSSSSSSSSETANNNNDDANGKLVVLPPCVSHFCMSLEMRCSRWW